MRFALRLIGGFELFSAALVLGFQVLVVVPRVEMHLLVPDFHDAA